MDLLPLQLARPSKMLFAFHKNHALLLGLIAAIAASLTALARPAQPEASSTPSASPSATPIVFAEQTLADLKQLRQAALTSDYAFKQVAHLANNIGPRLTGSAQAAKAVEYVAGEMAAQGHGGDAYDQAVVYRSDGPVAAAKLGAAACLIRSVGGADYRIPHTGQTNYENGVPQIPAAAVTAEDADLIAYLAAEGETQMHLVLTPQTLPDVESANVIADIKGSEHPEQIVIVSGHLDSWDLATGAIDDGAGVAVAMETAHLIQQLHLKPKRTIRIIAWMNEENGSRGSKQYEKDHASEFANHFAVNETDGGAGHPTGLNLKTKPEVKKMFEPVAKILQEIGAGSLNLSEHVGADTEPMEKAGVPAFSPMQDSRFYFNYHHTPADTLDKIVPRELQENATVVAVAAYAFANAEQSLPR